MSLDEPKIWLAGALAALLALTAALVFVRRGPGRAPARGHVVFLWWLCLLLAGSEVISFRVAVWSLAPLCFALLREYFTLVDLRPQDRLAVWGAYLTIPFMIAFIQADWYGMFIISIPVYGFLGIPFLVAVAGRDPRGTVVSIGAIDFGLFLFVYCIGHLGPLARLSPGAAAHVILAVTVYDLTALLAPKRPGAGLARAAARVALTAPVAAALGWVLAPWAAVPAVRLAVLGMLLPAFAAVGRFTLAFIEADLGIDRRSAAPGTGLLIDAARSYLYAAPLAFHYLWYLSP